MRGLTPLGAVTAVVAAVLTLCAGAPAAAGAGEEWGVRFGADADGRERTRLEYRLHPGESLSDTIEVLNRGDRELEMSIGRTDAGYGSDGRAQRMPGTGTAEWLVPGATELRVPASDEVALAYTVTAPETVEPGRYSVALTIRQQANATEQGAVALRRDLVVLVHIDVPGRSSAEGVAGPAGGEPASPVGIVAATALIGAALLVALAILAVPLAVRAARR